MEHLMIKCSKEDTELITATQNTFGEIDVIEEDGFSGEEFIVLAIPIAQLTVQIIDFVCTHLTKKKTSSTKDVNDLRQIVINGENISLIGYTAEEAVKILKTLVK